MYQLRLANVIGLDIKNAQHSVAIDESLYGIQDQEAFLEYCREKKDSIEYTSKPERLDMLATRYKKLQFSASLPHDLANSFSKELADKVENARIWLKNEIEVGTERPFSRMKLVDGEKYFTDKEINALAGIGSAYQLIILAEERKLEDALKKHFMKAYISKSKQATLTDGQKKLQAMIGAGK